MRRGNQLLMFSGRSRGVRGVTSAGLRPSSEVVGQSDTEVQAENLFVKRGS